MASDNVVFTAQVVVVVVALAVRVYLGRLLLRSVSTIRKTELSAASGATSERSSEPEDLTHTSFAAAQSPESGTGRPCGRLPLGSAEGSPVMIVGGDRVDLLQFRPLPEARVHTPITFL